MSLLIANRRTRCGLGLALGLLLAGGARAQDTIATDRPGFTFNPRTVGAGTLQFEFGLPTWMIASGSDRAATSLDAAMRLGLSDRVEARLSTSYRAVAPEHGGPAGIGGLRAGLKIGVLTGSKVALSLIPEVVLPVGDDELVADDVAYSLVASAGVPMGPVGLTLIAGAQRDPSDEDSYRTSGLLVALVGHGFTDTLSAYVEVTALPGSGADPLYLGLGGAWLAGADVQFDVFADFGLVDAAVDVIAGVGLSIRFDRDEP